MIFCLAGLSLSMPYPVPDELYGPPPPAYEPKIGRVKMQVRTNLHVTSATIVLIEQNLFKCYMLVFLIQNWREFSGYTQLSKKIEDKRYNCIQVEIYNQNRLN